jgi:hypothetical protein
MQPSAGLGSLLLHATRGGKKERHLPNILPMPVGQGYLPTAIGAPAHVLYLGKKVWGARRGPRGPPGIGPGYLQASPTPWGGEA